MATVLVTDGEQRSALAAVRSLGLAGYTVCVAARGTVSLAGASRHAAAHVALPDPLVEPLRYADLAGEAARAHGCDLVLPVTDAAVLALLARPEAMAPARMPFPSLAEVQRITDKAAAAGIATELGIRVPRQVRAERRDDVAGLAAASAVPAPLVLKPARSVAGGEAGRTKHGVVHAADWREAQRAAARLPESAFPLLVQERIVGPGVGIFLLVWNGRLLATFMHRRLREKPPAGGVSVYAESIAPDDGLVSRSRALVDRFGWNGVAMVEYKVDAATGEPVLMEINGRLWGSLQLAIDSGVDFPRLLADAALGSTVTPVTSWKVGVKGRWFWGDVDHLLTRLRRSARSLHLTGDAPGRIATLAGFIGTTLRFPHDQVFRLDDPRPLWREMAARLGGSVA